MATYTHTTTVSGAPEVLNVTLPQAAQTHTSNAGEAVTIHWFVVNENTSTTDAVVTFDNLQFDDPGVSGNLEAFVNSVGQPVPSPVTIAPGETLDVTTQYISPDPGVGETVDVTASVDIDAVAA